MKRAVCAVAFILLSVPPLFAIKTNLIDDVIRMSKSGVSDETIIEYVQASKEQLAVTADDILAMKNAGVSDAVIQAVADKETPADQTPETAPAPSVAPATDTAEAPPPPAGPYQPGCWTFDPPVSLWWPPYGVVIPSQLWDPYWYQPRLDTRSGAPARAGVAAPREATAPRVSGDRVPPPVARERTPPPVARERLSPPSGERSGGSPARQPSSSGGGRSARSR